MYKYLLSGLERSGTDNYNGKFHEILTCGFHSHPLKYIIMNCILIETNAYNDLQAHIQRLLERISNLHALSEKSQTVRWLTTDDVCKALSITKRTLQYYRSCGIIPYTAIGNKVVYREENIRRLLEKNLIKAE